jgi:adenylate cyclase
MSAAAILLWLGWLAVAPVFGFPAVHPVGMMDSALNTDAGSPLGWSLLVGGLALLAFAYFLAEARGTLRPGLRWAAAYGVGLWLMSGVVLMPLMGLASEAAPRSATPGGAMAPKMGLPSADPMRPTFMMLHLGAMAPVGALVAWLLFGGALGVVSARGRTSMRATERGRPSMRRELGETADPPETGERPAPPPVPMDERWRAVLRGETRRSMVPRLGRRLFALAPSPWRCKFCNAPFRGPYAGAFRWIGYAPSRKNPQICARCMEHAPEGGALSPVAVLFADIREYTTLAERVSSAQATAILNRFYEVASRSLLDHEAVLGQIAGDEVMAVFVPGFAGRTYARKAVDAARALLEAIGYGTPQGNWLDVGAGVSTGEEYVGNVGGGGFKDFTALGDVTNTAARLQSAARGGEIVVCATTYSDVADAYPRASHEALELKGKRAPVEAYRISLHEAHNHGSVRR